MILYMIGSLLKHSYSTRYKFWCGVELGQRLMLLVFVTALPRDAVSIKYRVRFIAADSPPTDDVTHTAWIYPTIQD